ncbi:hypothetical protein CLAFUW4_01754 [Fulvia fulva]|uniref:Uncharacterized protein n=1 Tax=Passalora fulva TaxID=5499 RepID=A0A9Q8L7D2_PASFU|nr:uncharacterized protein CLAFUR5_01750 [Fulvia fulva]KAK4634849.1 hypothetical protein CLAFUR4_01752 [Fulvia fulva]KAK4637698.1 hypothetical protein CLAFUR0_01754 [Fulvia fulva]UJO12169.1 hypothetical protein CLAFUR5_01750 [Fulvia fulva]WPV08228.1 hypothetical protein CLAFUW4_01754 [Fulvia fulva]WPV23213.1 hypothetical protein CLAFUW7_01756 [Fulvia fulva]
MRSDSSTRTVSQLLPERPSSKPPQPPQKSPQVPGVQTPATVFEEHRSPTIQRALYPGLPAHPAAYKMPAYQSAHHNTRSLEQAKQPALSLSIPGKAYTVREAEGSPDFELLPPPPVIVSTSSDRCDSDSNNRSSSHSLLKYYASVDSGSPDDLYSATPIEEQTQVRRPPPAAITVTKAVFPPRAVRTSTASDVSRRTSFESTDPDEPTPPDEEDRRLTPVVESPIAAIRYPKVPRSSNQSVPRSPNYQVSPNSVTWPVARWQVPDKQVSSRHSPSFMGSNLAAKRRGPTAQQDLELGLKIHDLAYASHSRKNPQQAASISQKVRPSHRQESPFNGYGRVANKRESAWPLPNEVAAAVRSPPLRSPLWEPKLTPRRQGDDLYLSVSIATPLEAHFRQ